MQLDTLLVPLSPFSGPSSLFLSAPGYIVDYLGNQMPSTVRDEINAGFVRFKEWQEESVRIGSQFC